MGRKKKLGFSEMKMLSSRVELSDYYKFEKIAKDSGKKTIQEAINYLVVGVISGNLSLSGSGQ